MAQLDGGGWPLLLRNNGNHSFTDVSEAAGIAAGWAGGASNGLAFFDCDNDGDDEFGFNA